MSEAVVIPGVRDVRGSLDEPDDEYASAADDQPADGHPRACVVACPPHPRLGGSRSDRRLTAVADALARRGLACLRFDYGAWDEGEGELRDAAAAVEWAGERYQSVGLFGYSFGGCIALAAAADASDLAAVSALAPAARIGDVDAVAAIDDVECPGQVVCGERDDTVDWRPIVDRARDRGFAVTEIAADHHFVGQTDRVGALVADFFADRS